VLLDYQQHQRRLLPRLANAYAMTFAQDELLTIFHDVFSGARDTEEERQDLETLPQLSSPTPPGLPWTLSRLLARPVAGRGTWRRTGSRRCTETSMSMSPLKGTTPYSLQLVAKRLLGDYAKQFKGADFGTMAGYLADQVGDAAFNRSGLRRLAQNVADFGSTARSIGYVRSTASQRQLLTDRVHSMVRKWQIT
jgi:acyl-CoA oxidase